jgi:UDP:flavonoid glycosyltransferase YjiC (YdhE family)
MSDILFATWDGGGNVPPALGVAAELERRGHRVRFLGHAVQRDAIAAAGFGFTAYEKARPFASANPNPPEVVAQTFGDQAMGEDLLAHVDQHPADVVVIDCLLIGALRAAKDAGLRYVSLEHLFDGFLRTTWLATMGATDPVRVLDPERCWDAAAMSLVASLAELDQVVTEPRPANLRYSGPVVTGSPRPGNEAAVLVSLSTYNFPGQTPAMQNILDALAPLDPRVIVTTGPAIDAEDLRVPGNAEVHRFVPHTELMPQVSLVVGHGGHATTMQALAHDLPIAVMPMHPMLDQPMVGQAVEAAGAGRLLSKEAGADQLRTVIAELIEDGPHRAAAARLGAAIRAARGAETAAALVEELIEQPAQPVGALTVDHH